MEICPNCCEELVKKKYNRSNRLKCTSCGYETSKWEIEQEEKEYLELKLQQEKEQYQQNENYE